MLPRRVTEVVLPQCMPALHGADAEFQEIRVLNLNMRVKVLIGCSVRLCSCSFALFHPYSDSVV